MNDTVSVYEMVGGPYDGEFREIRGTPLCLWIPVVSKISFSTVVNSELPVTEPRDWVHQYELKVQRQFVKKKAGRSTRRVYKYKYVGIRELFNERDPERQG